MGPFIEDHLDVRNLPLRTHANMIKSEKSEPIDVNCPLRHLEFSSIFKFQL